MRCERGARLAGPEHSVDPDGCYCLGCDGGEDRAKALFIHDVFCHDCQDFRLENLLTRIREAYDAHSKGKGMASELLEALNHYALPIYNYRVKRILDIYRLAMKYREAELELCTASLTKMPEELRELEANRTKGLKILLEATF